MLGKVRRHAGGHAALCLALVAAVVVAVWFTFLPADASVTSDDGAYALHVRGLEQGGWSIPHVLSDVDPDGLTYPYQNSYISDEGYFPAPRHALWIRALRQVANLGGTAGMRALPAFGFCAAVASTVAMAGFVHGRRARWIAGLLALGSPLLFNALQLWAHAAVAGGIALAMLAALHLMRSGLQAQWLLVAVVGGAVAAGWRADGLVWAAAVAAVIAFEGIRTRHFTLALAGGGMGAASVAAFVLAGEYAASIVGGSEIGSRASRASGSWSGRLEGAVHTFFSAADSEVSLVLVGAALGLTAFAVLKLRRRDVEEARVLLVIAAAMWVVRSALRPDEMASGLLGAWPVALVMFARPRHDVRRPEWQLAAMVVLASAGIAVTQYDEGGGLNWGGRFLAPAIPALAVLAAGGIVHLASDARARRAVPAIAAVVASCVIGMLIFDASVRVRHADYVDEVASVRVPVVTSSTPLPRLAWATYPDLQWLHVPTDADGDEDADALLALLRQGGIETVALFVVSDEVAAQFPSAGDHAGEHVDVVSVPPPSARP